MPLLLNIPSLLVSNNFSLQKFHNFLHFSSTHPIQKYREKQQRDIRKTLKMAIEGIPESMQAAQVVEFKKPYKIHSIPTPSKLQPFEMLVRVAVASFCHTDMMVSEGIFPAKLPITASHEGSGTVVSLGSDVKNFNLGDRVLIAIMQERCHSCSDCKSAATQYCADVKRMSGVTADGSFAQYQVADARECCKLPDNLSFQSAAPLACAGKFIFYYSASLIDTLLRNHCIRRPHAPRSEARSMDRNRRCRRRSRTPRSPNGQGTGSESNRNRCP